MSSISKHARRGVHARSWRALRVCVLQLGSWAASGAVPSASLWHAAGARQWCVALARVTRLCCSHAAQRDTGSDRNAGDAWDPSLRIRELEAQLSAQEDRVASLSAQLLAASSPRSSPQSWEDGWQMHELVTFTGGSGFNALCGELKRYTTHVAHVLPVSDDGGSTSEIVRVLGGPAVGDIRSRCLRLADEATTEARAVKALLGHRLPADASAAKAEWHTIVEGDHPLWSGVSEPYKHTVRSFLAHFHFQLIRQANEGGLPFCFSGGSVGNFFFAGARLFFRSLDAAVFLFSRVSGIPANSLVLPIVSTSSRLVLGAELEDGTMLRGQTALSHPTAVGAAAGPDLRVVDKTRGSTSELPLPSRVRRVLYLSTEATDELHEVFPRVNRQVLERIGTADAVVYGIGSLWSSICPSLVLSGVGEAIAERDCAKILMLNGTRDRETTGMGVLDIIDAITSSLNRQHARGGDSNSVRALHHSSDAYITAVVAPECGEFDAEAVRDRLSPHQLVVTVPSEVDEQGRRVFQPKAVIGALRQVVSQHRALRAERTGYTI